MSWLSASIIMKDCDQGFCGSTLQDLNTHTCMKISVWFAVQCVKDDDRSLPDRKLSAPQSPVTRITGQPSLHRAHHSDVSPDASWEQSTSLVPLLDRPE